jgi:peptidyl-prolyl cis-trans isomerase SurA
MDQRSATARSALVAAALASAGALAVSVWVRDAAAQQQPAPRQAATQPAPAKAQKPSPAAAKAEQAIVALVNDDPITAYEIDQRAKFLSLNANITDKVKENFKRLAAADSTNQRVRAILEEIVRTNPGKTREQIGAIFDERKNQFAMSLQKQAVDGARAAMIPQFRKEAQEELIEERLKLQEAKRNGLEITDDEVKRMMKTISDRNKMTEEQFVQHIRSLGFDIATMQERTRAQVAWREVVRRKFSAQVSITNRDVDRALSVSANEAGEDTVELQVQKITLAMPAAMEQSSLARRYAEADGLRQRFGGCKTMASLAKEGTSARFEDLKYIRPSSIPEPTRSLLLSARDGDVLPPTTGAGGIELYAVCGRRPLKDDEKVREKAQEELAAKEYEIVAKRYLRDLRQDAHIEFR